MKTAIALAFLLAASMPSIADDVAKPVSTPAHADAPPAKCASLPECQKKIDDLTAQLATQTSNGAVQGLAYQRVRDQRDQAMAALADVQVQASLQQQALEAMNSDAAKKAPASVPAH